MKGFIFDLDGTLLDSLGMWRKIDIEYMARHGIEFKEEYAHIIKKLTFHECAYYFRDTLGVKREIDDIIQDWQDMSFHEYSENLELKPYAYEFVKECKKHGKIVLATSCNRDCAIVALKRCGIYEDMDAIITTNEIGYNKQHPEIYLKSLEMLGCEKENCYVFEDVLSAIKTAHDAGFKVIGIKDKMWEKEEHLIKNYCVKYIDSFKELIECDKID